MRSSSCVMACLRFTGCARRHTGDQQAPRRRDPRDVSIALHASKPAIAAHYNAGSASRGACELDPAALNLTTEILGYTSFCFVRLDASCADETLVRALAALCAALENMHEVDGPPGEDARRRGRYQLLRAIPELGLARDIDDPGIARADALVRLECAAPQPLDTFAGALRALIEARGGSIYERSGVAKPRSYTSHAMAQYAYAHALAPASGRRHALGVVTPQNKTREWWSMDWMRRESFFLPRYDAGGRIVAKGHALASAAGVPCINRRLVHHPRGYGLGEGYDFIGYFEFAEADAPVFRQVMAALRDTAQNPEWDYVREGPEWWGRRVGTPGVLWR
jgi:hypothetical protein